MRLLHEKSGEEYEFELKDWIRKLEDTDGWREIPIQAGDEQQKPDPTRWEDEDEEDEDAEKKEKKKKNQGRTDC